MRKTREEKGITLIALIITIVVLLILTVVAIRAVQGDGIIQHAKNAQTGYEEAQAKENSILSDYQQYLDNKGDVGPWKQEENIIYMTGTDGQKVELQIGDKVNYKEPAEGSKTYSASYDESGAKGGFSTENLEWRVLGITENGKIELISTAPTIGNMSFSGEKAYLNSISILNNACNILYSTDIGIARSLNMEDIDKLAGITTYESKKEQNNDLFGIKREYRYETDKIQYRESNDGGSTWGEWINSDYTTLKYPGKTEINSTNPTITYTVTDGNYYYTIADKINITTRDGASMSEIINNNIDVKQWLATNILHFSIKSGESGLIWFSVKILTEGRTKLQPLFNSNVGGGGSGQYYSIRPVITLNSDVKLSDTDNDGIWEIN